MHQAEVAIAGAGTIGMALALELQRRGKRVCLLERGTAGSSASSAAAGMLAAHDPHNPPALQPLSTWSEQLYPAFLDRLAHLAPGHPVPLHTAWTLQAAANAPPMPLPAGVCPQAGPFHLLHEYSLDPRQLAAALVAACRQTSIRLLEGTALQGVDPAADGSLRVRTTGETLRCNQFVDCSGAWSSQHMRPVKGQMLRVALGAYTPNLPGYGNLVLRTPSVYVVPRLDGSALIGATVEEKGFCIKTNDAAIDNLRAQAAALLPKITGAPELERWAGLRPASPDGLPLLGAALQPGCFIATGHFRNGILLAPVTAHVMAQLLCGERTDVSLTAFRPDRFGPAGETIIAHPR